jgi:hypothetical protein
MGSLRHLLGFALAPLAACLVTIAVPEEASAGGSLRSGHSRGHGSYGHRSHGHRSYGHRSYGHRSTSRPRSYGGSFPAWYGGHLTRRHYTGYRYPYPDYGRRHHHRHHRYYRGHGFHVHLGHREGGTLSTGRLLYHCEACHHQYGSRDVFYRHLHDRHHLTQEQIPSVIFETSSGWAYRD